MSEQENRAAVARAVTAGMVDGDVEAALRAYAPDRSYHAPIMDQAPPGTPPAAGMGEAMRMTRAAFPDLAYTVDALIAEGDLVAVLYHWTGTNTGPPAGMPPTGRPVRATGAIVCRLADGRIVEQWDVDDRLDVLQQLGLLSAPPGPPGAGPAEGTPC